MALDARAVVRERLRRAGVVVDVSPLVHLFAQQLAVIRDPAKRKTLLCGGRAGKSMTMAHWYANGLQTKPGSKWLYTAQARTTAKNILWEPLREMNLRHGWGLDLNETELRARHPNGSWLLLAGMDTRRELEKARGIPWDGVGIDECGSHRPSYLQYYVEQVLETRLMDRDGELWMAGTPTPQAFGYFHDATQGISRGWSNHHWTAEQNPHVNFKRFLAETLERRGWDITNPILRRELFAEWSTESEDRVFRFLASRNVVPSLPPLTARDAWSRVLAIDYGVVHKTAFAILTFPKRYGREVFVEKSWSKVGLAPTEAADETKAAIDRYEPITTVGDLGGLGKPYARELEYRHGISLKMAHKTDKRSNIEITSDALHTGSLKSLDCNTELHRQWGSLLWDEHHLDIAKGQEDDEAHAVLYGYAETPAFLNATKEPELPTVPQHVLEDEEDYESPERDYLEAYSDE